MAQLQVLALPQASLHQLAASIHMLIHYLIYLHTKIGSIINDGKICKILYIIWLLTFLSLLLLVCSLFMVDRETNTKQIDRKKSHFEHAALILKNIQRFSADNIKYDILSMHYLEKWLTDFVDVMSFTLPFKKFHFAAGNRAKKNNQMMDVYWIHVKFHFIRLQHPLRDLETET